MASFASTSRLTLGRVSKSASPSLSSARRHFASTSQVQERKVTISFINTTTSFTLPSLSSLLEPLFPATVSQQPALAGIPHSLEGESHCDVDDVLEWDGVLNAVPKSKVSHSRKAMRHANKGLKDRTDLVHCAACGKPKLAHHICASCFMVINRAQKASKREALADAQAKLPTFPNVSIDTTQRDTTVVTATPSQGKTA